MREGADHPGDAPRPAAHAHLVPVLGSCGGGVPDAVDVWVGHRAQGGVDEHAAAVVDGQPGLPCQRRNREARGPHHCVGVDVVAVLQQQTVPGDLGHRCIRQHLDAEAIEGLVKGAAARVRSALRPASPW